MSVRSDRGLGVSRRLLLRERVELARFGRDEEARLDDVGVGDPAPQPLEQIAALGRDFADQLGLEIGRAEPGRDPGDGLGLAVLVEAGLQRAVDRQRLDHRRIIFARRVAHQRSHPPRMVDQRLQVLAASAGLPAYRAPAPRGPASSR